MDETNMQLEEFLALPKAERKAKYMSLPKEVRLRAREVLEARRGIAFRKDGGRMVLKKETYIEQIVRLTHKKDVLLAERILKLDGRINELKQELQAHWGDEALAEAEAALKNPS